MSCVAQDANHADRLWRYADALQEVLSATPAGGSETLPMRLAQGRLLSEALCSSEALPPFDNSAMDGFALPLSSEAAAGQEFEIVGEQAAGDEACDLGAAGCGMEIMTGARLPSGLSSVVPVEHTVVLPDSGGRRRIRLLQAVTLGQHVRYRGEDVPADTPVMAAGTLLGTEQRSLAAALGIASCRVARQPRIAVLATGRELVDDPDQPLASGQIRNSNRPYLESRLGEAGGVLAWSETVTDEIDAFLAALDRAPARYRWAAMISCPMHCASGERIFAFTNARSVQASRSCLPSCPEIDCTSACPETRFRPRWAFASSSNRRFGTGSAYPSNRPSGSRC